MHKYNRVYVIDKSQLKKKEKYHPNGATYKY